MPEQQIRILLYPLGADEEIDFAGFHGTGDVPAVGDRVQTIDRSGNAPGERGTLWQVVRRDWYATRYTHDSTIVEVALHVRPYETVGV